jgi:pyruvate/2-oxoglutarate/acetoin dehydrogenase E1 component
MSEVTYREAITRALADELAADEDVFVLGEDVAAAGGVFKATAGLFERFGSDRVIDTPISEQAIVGAAIGAAVHGLRPVAEIMFADFAGVCFDQIANQLAKYRYMTGAQVTLPVTIRLANGGGTGFGAQHSQSVENWFLNIPGLKLAVPASPADAYGLLRSAIRDPNPVLFFEHKGLFNVKGEIGEPVPLGTAAIAREGADVTIVATQLMLRRALEATERLADDGIDAELIDPRTLVPLDVATIAASVERTNRLLVVQEAPADGSWGASLVSRLVQEHFDAFDAAPRLLAAPATPIPYAESLETAWLPSVDGIVAAARELITGS